MLGEILHYLSNPVYFFGFTLVIGIAYIYVWVTSLRDLVRPETGFYSLDQDSRREQRLPRPVLKYSGRRVSIRSKVLRDGEETMRGRGRRVRIKRAA